MNQEILNQNHNTDTSNVDNVLDMIPETSRISEIVGNTGKEAQEWLSPMPAAANPPLDSVPLWVVPSRTERMNNREGIRTYEMTPRQKCHGADKK